jgi:hypothetical protein
MFTAVEINGLQRKSESFFGQRNVNAHDIGRKEIRIGPQRDYGLVHNILIG